MKRISLILFFLLVCLPSVFGGASDPPGSLGFPCCSIISIDRVNGIATARILKTGKTFKFEVDSRSLLKTLRVGQKVWVNAATRRAGFTESESCCSVIGNTNLDLADSGRTAVAASAAETGAGGRTDPGRTLVSLPVRWEVKPSADLKGTSGRIVIQFPGMTSSGNNHVAVFEVGGKTRIGLSYGNKNFPLLDGEYDVEVNSARVSRVPVKRGMDTRIHIGTIRFEVDSSTSVEVYDLTEKTRLCLSYGSMMCGVPSGDYYVKVGGSRKKVSLVDGQVIDF